MNLQKFILLFAVIVIRRINQMIKDEHSNNGRPLQTAVKTKNLTFYLF